MNRWTLDRTGGTRGCFGGADGRCRGIPGRFLATGCYPAFLEFGMAGEQVCKQRADVMLQTAGGWWEGEGEVERRRVGVEEGEEE